MNEVFRPAENMRINTKNSFLKLTILFEKPLPDKGVCLILNLFFFLFIKTYTSTNYTKLKKNKDIYIYIKRYTHKN